MKGRGMVPRRRGVAPAISGTSLDVVSALEVAGVEFTNGKRPEVREISCQSQNSADASIAVWV
jgi:hypothetical protein